MLCQLLDLSPIEPVHGISRDNTVVIFDGIRRLIAAKIILNPNLVSNMHMTFSDEDNGGRIKLSELMIRYHNCLTDDMKESLMNPPLVAYTPSMHTLESASSEIMIANIQGMFDDEDY